jgi:hypothetical protein
MPGSFLTELDENKFAFEELLMVKPFFPDISSRDG